MSSKEHQEMMATMHELITVIKELVRLSDRPHSSSPDGRVDAATAWATSPNISRLGGDVGQTLRQFAQKQKQAAQALAGQAGNAAFNQAAGGLLPDALTSFNDKYEQITEATTNQVTAIAQQYAAAGRPLNDERLQQLSAQFRTVNERMFNERRRVETMIDKGTGVSRALGTTDIFRNLKHYTQDLYHDPDSVDPERKWQIAAEITQWVQKNAPILSKVSEKGGWHAAKAAILGNQMFHSD